MVRILREYSPDQPGALQGYVRLLELYFRVDPQLLESGTLEVLVQKLQFSPQQKQCFLERCAAVRKRLSEDPIPAQGSKGLLSQLLEQVAEGAPGFLPCEPDPALSNTEESAQSCQAIQLATHNGGKPQPFQSKTESQ